MCEYTCYFQQAHSDLAYIPSMVLAKLATRRDATKLERHYGVTGHSDEQCDVTGNPLHTPLLLQGPQVITEHISQYTLHTAAADSGGPIKQGKSENLLTHVSM